MGLSANSKVERGLLEEIASEISPTPRKQVTSSLNGALYNLGSDYDKRDSIKNRDVRRVVKNKDLFTNRMKKLGPKSVYVLNNYARKIDLIDEPAWKKNIPKDVYLKYMDGQKCKSEHGTFEEIEDDDLIISGRRKPEKGKQINIWNIVYIR